MLAHEGAPQRLIAHGVVTVLVSALLIVINLTLADAFPWSAFAVSGMTIGMLAHWFVLACGHLDFEVAIAEPAHLR